MRGAAHIGMLVLIGVLSAVGSSGQESAGTLTVESVMAHLTGGGERAWRTKEGWVSILNPEGPRCVRGEIWTFGHDGKGVKKTCVNGVAREQEFTWIWVGTEGDQPILKIDETRYVVKLGREKAQVEGDPPVLVTILRTPRTDQIDPLKEIELKFQGR